MKKLNIIIFLLFLTNVFAQQKNKPVLNQKTQNATSFVFLKDGLTDFVVTSCPNKKQSELYRKTIDWVAVTYNVPKEVIKAQIENDYIRIEGYSENMLHLTTESGIFPIKSKYQIEISFKDGRYKFDVISVDYKLAHWIEIDLSQSNVYFEENTDILEKNNKSFPIDISTYFNNLNDKLKDFIQNKEIPSKKSDW